MMLMIISDNGSVGSPAMKIKMWYQALVINQSIKPLINHAMYSCL